MERDSMPGASNIYSRTIYKKSKRALGTLHYFRKVVPFALLFFCIFSG